MLRHHFLQRLQASRVLCRPVFYPLSSMPMFTQADNPVAYGPGLRALVLPSGHNRTEEEVEYIAGVIKALLTDKGTASAAVQPTGWLHYKQEVLSTIAKAKATGLCLPFTHDGEAFSLQAVTAADADNAEVIAFMTALRKENPHAFLSDFPVTEDTLREMLRHYVGRDRDFLLFFIQKGEERLGHMGLDDFAFQEHACVAEGLIMRRDAGRGVAAAACEALYAWAKRVLGITRVYNHVVGSNKQVRLLAAAQGFKELNKTSLYKANVPGGSVFRPMYILGHDKPDEHFVFSVKDL